MMVISYFGLEFYHKLISALDQIEICHVVLLISHHFSQKATQEYVPPKRDKNEEEDSAKSNGGGEAYEREAKNSLFYHIYRGYSSKQ